MNNIYLIGFMGTGKSTIARELTVQTDMKQIEMDQLLEEQQGMKISEMFARYGEEHFRDLETEFLKQLSGAENVVVSCGGGSVLREENAALMKACGKIVLLTAKPETIYERVKDCADRPILNGNMNVEYIRGLMEKRRARYEAVADVTIATDGKSREEICREILECLAER